MNFENYTLKYLKQKEKEVKKSTYCNYANNLKQVNQYIGIDEISQITTKDIENMCVNMVNDGYAYKTLSDMKMVTKSVLKFAKKNGDTQNEIDTINIPKNILEIAKSRTREEVEIYDKEEKQKLLDNLLNDINDDKQIQKQKIAIGILIMMQTGIRVGELCGLQWKDVSYRERKIDINKTVQRVFNPISNKSEVIIGSPKTETSKRKVPITDILYDVLERNKQESNDYIISDKEVKEPRTFRREYKKYIETIGIRYLHPHGLRHCFASDLINSGVNVKYASQILGHSNSGITLDVYTHTSNTELVEIANTINKDTMQNSTKTENTKMEQMNLNGLIEVLKCCSNVVININTGPVYNNFSERVNK